MKKYFIYAFTHYGKFVCEQEVIEANQTLLKGYFEGNIKQKYTFIKQEKDTCFYEEN